MAKKRNTAILFISILTAALGIFLAQHIFHGAAGSYAVVTSHGEEIARMPLSETAQLLVGDSARGYNRICTGDGCVSVEEADCPDQICVREGKKRYAGGTIACLPHELVITVEAGSDSGVDSVAW